MEKVRKFFPTICRNSLEFYLRAVDGCPVLTRDEENELSKRFYYRQDFHAAKILILAHLRFVVHVSKNYSGYGLTQTDLIQEGNVGLMKAVKKFNPSMGVRLVSFAVHWIKAEMHEYILRNWRVVKSVTTKAQRKLFFNLKRNKTHLDWFNVHEIRSIAAKLRVKNREVEEMESRLTAQDVSFDLMRDVNRKSGKFFVSALCLEDKKSNFSKVLEEENWNGYASRKLNRAFRKLNRRSQYIIYERWLNFDQKSTLRSLAIGFGVSLERIRQLEKTAMREMRCAIGTKER